MAENIDWLEEQLGDGEDDYFIFDCPGIRDVTVEWGGGPLQSINHCTREYVAGDICGDTGPYRIHVLCITIEKPYTGSFLQFV